MKTTLLDIIVVPETPSAGHPVPVAAAVIAVIAVIVIAAVLVLYWRKRK